MKTLVEKEIVIDFTQSDYRSGSTTLSRMFVAMFKFYGVKCEIEFKDDDPLSAKQVEQIYNSHPMPFDNINLEEFLSFYKEFHGDSFKSIKIITR